MVYQCPISLLVYPLNCEDGWKGSLASHPDLQGRVVLEARRTQEILDFITCLLGVCLCCPARILCGDSPGNSSAGFESSLISNIERTLSCSFKHVLCQVHICLEKGVKKLQGVAV